MILAPSSDLHFAPPGFYSKRGVIRDEMSTSKPNYIIREGRGPQDAQPQYELWLRATQALPRAWRSSLRNVEHQLRNVAQYPECRLYAERPDGTLLGYIGTHPPFERIASQHGPPAKSLGWAVPFGFPWTYPVDDGLEVALYDEMICRTPRVYRDFQRDIYIQRFRESWSRPIAFLERRGWKLLERIPLIGWKIDEPKAVSRELVPVRRDDLALVSELSREDDTAADKFSTADLQNRFDGGWIVHDTFWRLGDRGAFALEVRGPWAAVTVFFARPKAWIETLQVAAAKAHALGSREMYFTVEPHEPRRREALERQGFDEVDAGVYYVRNAD